MSLANPIGAGPAATAIPTASAVALRDVAITYGSLRVLDRLDLDVARGEFIVLLGPSGCGKSTLLNAIAGLIDISDGEIWIGGRNMTWAEPKDRGIGMVFQSYALYPTMSVERNLSFGLRIAGVPKAEIRQRIGEAARMLQLGPLLARKPSELSGGQRQRVAIGRALVRKVEVFLFDEPLSNLDAKLRNELRVEIKRLHQSLGNTMIYVTHDQVEALTLADRIAVMRSGVIQQLATPHDIYHQPANLFVAGFIGSPGMNMFEGRIVQDGQSRRFDLGDAVIDLDGYRFSRSPEAAEAVFGIRPEHIGVGPAPAGRVTAEGAIRLLEPMGSDTILWTEFAGRPITIRADGEHDYAVGERVRFHFDLRRASIFDKAGGARL